MKITEIETFLDSPNPQNRMKAIIELRNHEPSLVVPLLKRKMYDKELIIRSFVAMGLGSKRTDEGFQSLLDLIENDEDPNVKAEAANSLAKYGQKSIPHLIEFFERESHWLIRQSIFAVINEINSPELIYQLCLCALEGEELVVKLTAINSLGLLKGTIYENDAIDILFALSTDKTVEIRVQVAKTLAIFEDIRSQVALAELRHDCDYRVVAATLENMIQ